MRLRKTMPCNVLLAMLALCCGRGWTAEPDAQNSQLINKLIRDLDSSEYQVRRQATRELAQHGAEVLEPLSLVLKQGSLEQRTRAVDVIGRIYSRGEADSFYQAEQLLAQVAQDASGSLMSTAQTTLDTKYLVRQRLAVAEIEKMGGRVLMVEPMTIFDPDEPADALQPGGGEMTGLVIGIMIDRKWTGGDEGLKHLRRLTRLSVLYRDKKAPLSQQALDELQADMPRLMQAVRGPAYMGIKPIDLRPINGISGCGIGEVTPDSAAEKAGIKPQDVVTSFDQQPVKDFDSLIELISEKMPGDKVPVTVVRNGKPLDLELELGAWPKLNSMP